METETVIKLVNLVRYFVLTSTTEAGSGHPSSSLSAVELMTTLFFGGFYAYDLENPNNPKNDRIIFSKGHASPLLYALYTAAGAISQDELVTLRKSASSLEGHPTQRFPYTEAPTGSLGQGLSIGLGMALAGAPRVFVLLGDSELAEGSNWEAMQLASYYKVNNLVGLVDINRLGQSGETMLGWDIKTYENRIRTFGWEVLVIEDGHSIEQVKEAYRQAEHVKDKPVMILAKTVKGKGVSFLENQEGWHGKTVSKEQLADVLIELGEVDKNIRGVIRKPV